MQLVLAALAAALLTGCMLFAQPPEALDYSRTRSSENGLYRGTIRPPRVTRHLPRARRGTAAPVLLNTQPRG